MSSMDKKSGSTKLGKLKSNSGKSVNGSTKLGNLKSPKSTSAKRVPARPGKYAGQVLAQKPRKAKAGDTSQTDQAMYHLWETLYQDRRKRA